MAETVTYDFVKASLGHSVRDVDIGDNLDLIDAAISARADSITALEALADGKIIVGDSDGAAADVAMSGHATIVNTGEVTLASILLKGIVTLLLSFETNEQTATKIYFPFAVSISKIRSIVMVQLGGTDTGTITGANSVDTSENGVVTVAISAALNDEDDASPTTNNTVAAGSYYKLTTLKSTAGGKVLVTLEYARTA